jgi:hypothetical protein
MNNSISVKFSEPKCAQEAWGSVEKERCRIKMIKQVLRKNMRPEKQRRGRNKEVGRKQEKE